MAFNGSGVHNRVHDWTTDLANTIPVTASRMDAEHDDISTALSNTICRDGQSTTTARIPFAQGVSAAAGSTSSVAYAQTNDPNTGLYFPAADQIGLVAGGTATLTSTATKLTATVAVDFSAGVAPASDDGAALGSTSQKWSDLFLAAGAVINFNSGDGTITHSSNTLAIAGVAVTFDTTPTPASSDGAALGTSSLMWSDLFLASGAVVNFNNGDVTITHSSNQIAVTGGTLACEALSPSGDVAVNTNKFNVTASSGNTAVAGTLAVSGASTLTGAVSANNSAGVTARNTPKAFGKVVNDTLVAGSFNVTNVAVDTSGGLNNHLVTLSVALANTNYIVMLTVDNENANGGLTMGYNTLTTSTFKVRGAAGTGNGNVNPDSYSFVVFSNE